MYTPVYSCTHWLRPRNLNMVLDLQCRYTPVYSCTVPTHWLRPRNLNMVLDLQCLLLCTAVLIG